MSKKAATRFYRNKARWKSFKIARFVLFAACSSADANVQEEIRRQKARFSRVKIKFEVWDDSRLLRKLQPHPELVRRFLGEFWVPIVCAGGSVTQGVTLSGASTPRLSALAALVEPVVEALGAAKQAELDQIRELIRRGQPTEAGKRLDAFRQSSVWGVLPPRARAYAMRLQASLALDHKHDLARTDSFLAEARAADPDGDFRVIEAVLLHRRTGVEAALAALGAVDNVDVYNLRLALWLSQGKAAEVLAFVEQPDFESTAETWRLRALGVVDVAPLG